MTPPSLSLSPGFDAIAIAGVPQAMSPGAGFDAALAGTMSGATPMVQAARTAPAPPDSYIRAAT